MSSAGLRKIKLDSKSKITWPSNGNCLCTGFAGILCGSLTNQNMALGYSTL